MSPTKKMMGVCPECQQSRIPVFWDGCDESEHIDDYGFQVSLIQESISCYYLALHYAYGSMCPGSGQSPQAVYEAK